MHMLSLTFSVDLGLRAVSAHIRGNTTLRSLNIQNVSTLISWLKSPRDQIFYQNKLVGSADVISVFTCSLNESHVSHLALSGNTSLSDTFAEEFFTNLASPHLRTLDISLIGLTPAAAPFVISYLSSSRALRLRELRCNGNRLGLDAVREIVRSTQNKNFSLQKLELFANSGAVSPADHSDDPDLWPVDTMWRTLARCLERNETFQRITENEALSLLRHSRPLLLPRRQLHSTSPSIS